MNGWEYVQFRAVRKEVGGDKDLIEEWEADWRLLDWKMAGGGTYCGFLAGLRC
jgi:hypothetical protein